MDLSVVWTTLSKYCIISVLCKSYYILIVLKNLCFDYFVRIKLVLTVSKNEMAQFRTKLSHCLLCLHIGLETIKWALP